MRWIVFSLLFLVSTRGGFTQAAAPAEPATPKEPAALLAAAAPYYDYSNPSLHPWYLKASYQLYDRDGKPGEQGTFEYWWASPKVHRSTWTRPGATHTDWYTADGKHAYKGSGQPISLFEYKIQDAVVSPLPSAPDLEPTLYRLEGQTLSAGNVKFPCVEILPTMTHYGSSSPVPLGWFPSYCFDPKIPILRLSFSLGNLTTGFGKIVKVQERFLPKEIEMNEGKKKVLTLEAEEIAGIPKTDVALAPDSDASVAGSLSKTIDSKVMNGTLLKKEVPVYPEDAKEARISGTVTLAAIIGMDGGIHDLRVLTAPSPSLAVSALWAVSHWEYKPCQVDGQPVDVSTTVYVIYKLGD